MDVLIKHQPSFALAVVKLGPLEEIKAEPGSMVSHSSGVTTDTKMTGGLMGGLKRMIGGEDLFQNTWKGSPEGGEITLAPTLTGDMIVLELQSQPFFLRSGAYVASEKEVAMDSSWGGSKGFFGGVGMILLKISGPGKCIAASYGAIEERSLAEGESYIVDTGHVVGFDSSVSYAVQKSGGWKSTILGGEGLVCRFSGPGRVIIQTRSEESFVGWLMAKLPTKSNT